MRVAIIQQAGSPGDLGANVSKLTNAIKTCVSHNADLILCTPGSLHPACCDSLLNHLPYSSMLSQCIQDIEALIPASVNTVLVGLEGIDASLHVHDQARVANTLIKGHMDKGMISDDPLVVDASHEIEIGGSKRTLELIVNHHGYSRDTTEPISAEADVVIKLEPVGSYDRDIYLGTSEITTSGGDHMVCTPFFEGVLICDVCDGLSLEEVGIYPASSYECLISDKNQTDQATREDVLTFQALSYALQKYVEYNTFSDVVLGVSGGMDSALVAAIAVHALGPEHVHAVMLPGPYTTDQSLEDARALIANLNISSCELPITDACEMMKQLTGVNSQTLAEQNIQARLRGLALMTVSNKENYLVLNTSNKSEAALGYSTLYGDTVGGFAPLADLFKTEVYGVARAAGCFFDKGNPIPQSIFEKAPSAELAPGQTDESSLGMSYANLDRVLQAYLTADITDPNQIAEKLDLDEALVKRIITQFHANRFKRDQEPFGPTVSSTPLYRTRVRPLSCTWNDNNSIEL